jgi:hypothetical protein
MSLDIIVYTKQLSDDYIPKIVKRLNDFEMVCEANPDCSFNEQTGFLPFKFRLTNPPFPILKDKELITGFELYISDFDLEDEKQKAKPKQGFIDKLLGKKQPDNPLFTADIDNRLKESKKMVSFVWHVADSFELRFASLASAILTELTDGVCTYPADDIWYENENFVEKTWQEIKDYETTLLKERDLKFHEFKGWDNSF